LLGGVVNAAVGRYAAFKESKGMAAALRAEMVALLEVARQRQYLSGLGDVIARLEQPAYQPVLGDLFGFRVTRDYFSVFHATCSRIGALDDLAANVARFYVVAKALVEDATMMTEFKESLASSGQNKPLNREAILHISVSMRDLLRTMLEDGDVIERKLHEQCQRRWLRCIP
jgi:hypothetical protein